MEIFADVYKEINTSYVDEVEPGELIRAAIDGMLNSLDPYTDFYSEAQVEDYKYQMTGTYAGFGLSIRTIDSDFYIDNPVEGFACQKAGLRAGDKIKSIDGTETYQKTKNEVFELLKGRAGTTSIIKIERPIVGELEFELTREKIASKNVPYFNLMNEIGYIKLAGFAPNAAKEVRDAVLNLKNNGAQKFVLDLRDNGGGLLNEAIDIVNIFIPRGQVVVETRGKFKEDNRTYKTLNSPVDIQSPLIILINGNSASASEIVSGSLQDLDRAVLIGRTSFGKGLVQSTKTLSYNTSIKITTAKYYLPSGRLIQRLDYSNKVNGKAFAVADSLKQKFKTKNGRFVVDGQGIEPDLTIEKFPFSELSESLLKNHLFFKYAAQYREQHDSIFSPLSFEVSDEIFSDFCKFISDKDYAYVTKTEKEIQQLEEQAIQDNYHDLLAEELSKLKITMSEIKQSDIQNHKEEIKRILDSEISQHFFYERGYIESRFDYDDDWEKSKELFSDIHVFNQYLVP